MTHFAPIRFYKQTMLPHKSLYTQQFLHADILTQRGLLTKKLFTQTPLHTEVFTQRRTYLHTDAVYKDVFALTKKRRIGVFAHKNLFHRETFAQNSFNACFLHKKHLTKRNLYTQTAHKKITNRLFCAQQFTQKQFYTAFFLRTETFTQKNIFTTVFTDRRFLHRKFSAQKTYDRRFYAPHFLHTDAFTHRCPYTATNCTQKLVHTARVYTTNFYTERLCFPFLITYLSCSPSQFFLHLFKQMLTSEKPKTVKIVDEYNYITH